MAGTYDGSITIDSRIDTSGAEAGIKKLEGVVGKGMKAAAVAIGAAATALSGMAIASIKSASNLQEVQNVVDVTFKNSAQVVNQWAKDAGEAFGMSELNAKKFIGTMGAMLSSMGLNK